MSNTGCNFYQPQPDRIHLHLAHGLGKHHATEPIEQVVCQTMDLEPVGIHNHGGRTDCPKVKAVLALFNEVFHGAAVAVKPDNIPDGRSMLVTTNVYW